MIVMKCPECKEQNLKNYGKVWRTNKETLVREKVQRYICDSCGKITKEPIEEVENKK
jgi:transposase-like protein